jgi:hypothetical protein
MTRKQFHAAYPLQCDTGSYYNEAVTANPLHDAVTAGSLECVKLLVEKIEDSEKGRKIGQYGEFNVLTLSMLLITCRFI